MKTIQRFVLSLFPVLLEFLHYIYLLNSLWDQLKNEACEVLQVLIAMGKMQLLSFSYRKMYQFYFNPLTEKQTSNSTLVQIQCMRGHAASFSSTKETASDFSRKEVTGRPEWLISIMHQSSRSGARQTASSAPRVWCCRGGPWPCLVPFQFSSARKVEKKISDA